MDLSNTLVYLVLAAGMSFLFSGIEVGFMALNPVRIRRLAKNRFYAAENLKKHLEEPEPFLWTILLANTAANFLVVALVVYAFRHHLRLHPLADFLAIAFILFGFYTFFDLLPKMLVRRFPNRLTILFTYPLELLFRVLNPVSRVIARMAAFAEAGGKPSAPQSKLFRDREDLEALVRDHGPNLRTGERDLIARVLDLQDETVQAAMTPIHSAHWVPPYLSLQDTITRCKRHNASRVLVRTASQDYKLTLGIFHLKHTLFTEELDTTLPVEKFASQALYLKANLPLDAALQEMKKAGHRVAIVMDRNNREIGVISLNAILRKIFKDVDL